jgi:hypothetical protein
MSGSARMCGTTARPPLRGRSHAQRRARARTAALRAGRGVHRVQHAENAARVDEAALERGRSRAARVRHGVQQARQRLRACRWV